MSRIITNNQLINRIQTTFSPIHRAIIRAYSIAERLGIDEAEEIRPHSASWIRQDKRLAIEARYGHLCSFCGRSWHPSSDADGAYLCSLDHILSWKKVTVVAEMLQNHGTSPVLRKAMSNLQVSQLSPKALYKYRNSTSNLVFACSSCNQAKDTLDADEFLSVLWNEKKGAHFSVRFDARKKAFDQWFIHRDERGLKPLRRDARQLLAMDIHGYSKGASGIERANKYLNARSELYSRFSSQGVK